MTSSPASSKTRRIALYVLLGLISLLFLFAGGQKVIGADEMLSNMARLHWPAGATRLLGLFEVVLVALLWWRPARTLALALLLLIMAGAAGSHIAVGDPPSGFMPQFAFAALIGGALMVDRGRALWRFLFRSNSASPTGERVARPAEARAA